MARLGINPLDATWVKIAAHLHERINDLHMQMEACPADPVAFAKAQGRIAEIRDLIDAIEPPERPDPKPGTSLY